MSILFIITAVILIVSLYDYSISKNWDQVTSEKRNEVVFKDRNKKYGAYQIRRDYNKSLTKVMAFVVFFSALCYIGIVSLSSFTAPEVKIPVADLDEEIEPKQLILDLYIAPKVNTGESSSTSRKTVEHLNLVVSDNASTEKVSTQDELKDVDAGSSTSEGTNLFGTSDRDVEGTDEGSDAKGVNENEIVEIAQFDAVFPGGIKALNEFLTKNLRYPERALEVGLQGKVVLRFVVEKNGSVQNVEVIKGVPNCKDFDNEAIRVIKKMPKWTPAYHNGKYVRSYYVLPVNFQIK